MSIWVVLKDLLLFFRDKKSFFTLFFMPIILIAILGAAFGDNMKKDSEIRINSFRVGITDQDKSATSKMFLSTLSKSELSDIFDVKVTSKNQLERDLNSRDITMGIIIMPDFEKSLLNHDHVQLNILKGPNSNLQEMVLENVVLQFFQNYHMNRILVPLNQGKEVEIVSDQLKKELVNERNIHINSQPITSFQYYAGGMGVLFLLMTVVFLVGSMIEEKEEDVYKRLLVSKLSNTSYIVGKLLGILLMSMIQLAIIILFTSFVFKVNWGEPFTVFMIGCSFIVNAAGFGVLIGSFIKREKTFNSVGILGTQVLAALGGSMIPLYLFPQWLINISYFLPNSLALQMFLKSMSGADFSEIQSSLLLSCGMGLAFFIIALIRMSFERKHRYA
ncbi:MULTISPECIES: ABC transporter permease [Bacillus]|uniref:ABC transporter permease n=1 Tax=Bacillus TaxID=1386 RepID=UPI000D035B84|nr:MULTISPECIES: ABC transporter permease [Bacillus]MBU5260828.1 ABC transporter permease [Bacillus pumilus]MDF2003461.1 ABC transporter permease [Bacillus pumilus]MDF2024386.1 ABC transporter permease [Bacillus pumilus]MDF2028343.1 ABC transporter permease [Bacillus pumilus]MDF2089272.1 ABC transporter permease [Bacillus pumilus]